MKEKEYICPACRHKDTVEWGIKLVNNGTHFVKLYRCYTCGQFFGVELEEDKKRALCYGDNHPVYSLIEWVKPPEMEEHKKFKHCKPITKEDIINTLIDLFGKKENK